MIGNNGRFLKGHKSWLGKKLSVEHRMNLSKSHKGLKPRLGIKHTEESKKKMSLSHKGRIPWNKGKKGLLKHTKEWKEMMSKKMKGRISPNLGNHHTEECKEKMRKRMIGNKYGELLKGRKRTELEKINMRKPKPIGFGEKLSKANKGKPNLKIRGKNHYNWKGGYERKLWNNRQRRIKKIGSGGSHTLEDWELLKKQYNYTCPCCKRIEPEIKLTEDHIIPLSKGGSDNIENIQPLCRGCNCKKHTNIIKYQKLD